MTAQPIPPWHRDQNGSSDSGDGLELYKLAVEEYRFQAEYNWKRTQYMLAFNVAVAALGVALEPRTSLGSIPIFALGIVASVLGVYVTRVQHGYYRAARDRMTRIEASLKIPDDWRVDTTATLGQRNRRASVTVLVYVLFGAIALADLVSIVVALR